MPVFATLDAGDIAVVVAVFAVMTAAWIGIAHWLVHHPALGAPIRRWASLVTPVVLIAVGVLVIWEAGTLSLVG